MIWKEVLFGSLGGAIAVLIYNRLEQLQNKEEKAAGKTDANGWICADELTPDCSEYYLTYLSDGKALDLGVDEAILYYKKEIDTWFYIDGYEDESIDVSSYVLAWQPLPDIYRGWSTNDCTDD